MIRLDSKTLQSEKRIAKEIVNEYWWIILLALLAVLSILVGMAMDMPARGTFVGSIILLVVNVRVLIMNQRYYSAASKVLNEYNEQVMASARNFRIPPAREE